MFGKRPDGKRIKGLDPIVAVTPYLMPMRCDAQVFLDYDIDFFPLVNYVAQKAKEGFKITFMDILVAAFVRSVSQVPEVNRFIVNKQFFNRTQLSASMTVLMDTKDGTPVENVLKVKFDPADTIYEVAARFKDAIEKAKRPSDSGGGFPIRLAQAALKVPGLTTIAGVLIKLLDRYGLLPLSVMDDLPFFSTTYLTNVASIGLEKVYHHIYNFGDVTMFFSLGNTKRFNALDAKGNTVRKCTLPVGVVVDERICAGAYYAKFFSQMKKHMTHPELLETPPEKVFYNEGAEYHMPKPENVFVPQTGNRQNGIMV